MVQVMDYFLINMESATTIIKKLLEEQKITVDEFITLYDAIKQNMPCYTTPYTPSPIWVNYDWQKQPEFTITCDERFK